MEGTRKYGKHRVRKTPLKKVDCPAKISIKKVVKFPEFKLGKGKESQFAKKMVSKSVMKALKKDPKAVQKEVRYYVKFAAVTDHKNHEMGELAARVEPVDDRILNVLHSYALAGVRSCAVLQKLMISYVENDLFKDKVAPPRTRRRFYPSLSDVRNYLYKNREEFSKAHGDGTAGASTDGVALTLNSIHAGSTAPSTWMPDNTASTDGVALNSIQMGSTAASTGMPDSADIMHGGSTTATSTDGVALNSIQMGSTAPSTGMPDSADIMHGGSTTAASTDGVALNSIQMGSTVPSTGMPDSTGIMALMNAAVCEPDLTIHGSTVPSTIQGSQQHPVMVTQQQVMSTTDSLSTATAPSVQQQDFSILKQSLPPVFPHNQIPQVSSSLAESQTPSRTFVLSPTQMANQGLLTHVTATVKHIPISSAAADEANQTPAQYYPPCSFPMSEPLNYANHAATMSQVSHNPPLRQQAGLDIQNHQPTEHPGSSNTSTRAISNAADVMRQFAQLPAVQTVQETEQQSNSLPVLQPSPQIVDRQESHPKELTGTKPSRLRLILRMKELTRQLHDYSLLVKDTSNLQVLISGVEDIVGQASSFAAIQPQMPKLRPKKRKASEVFIKPRLSRRQSSASNVRGQRQMLGKQPRIQLEAANAGGQQQILGEPQQGQLGTANAGGQLQILGEPQTGAAYTSRNNNKCS